MIRSCDVHLPIAGHFHDHEIKDLTCICIKKVTKSRRGGNIEKKNVQREAYWMYQLKSMSPLGLNEGGRCI